MFEVHVRKPSDLCNDYEAIVELIKKKEHVIIGDNGKADAVLVSPNDYEDYCELHYRYFLYREIQEYRADVANRSQESDDYYDGMEKRLGIGLDKDAVEEWIYERLQESKHLLDDPNTELIPHEEVMASLKERVATRRKVSDILNISEDEDEVSFIDALRKHQQEFSEQLKYQQKFTDDWRELFNKRVREDVAFGGELWAALGNVSWYHDDDPNKNECGISSFRAVGDFISSMLGFSNYLDWLFEGFDAGVISEEIDSAMAERGWRHNAATPPKS